MIIALLSFLLQCLILPRPQPDPGITGPLPQNEWVMAFGQPTSITQVAPNGAYFYFPDTSSGNTSNYFLHSVTAPISGTLSISMQVSVASGSPVFQKDSDPANSCDNPAPGARLFFTSADPVDTNPNHRWWAKAGSYLLSAGTATVAISLSPVNWSNVNGISGDANLTATAGFNDALVNAKYIGLTFGGGCFYGHGVSVSGGTAQFQVLDYSVQ